MKLKIKKGQEKRYEHCPYCWDGWPKYLGLDENNFHQFECTNLECEAWFKIEDQKGIWDQRLGMELLENIVYYERCDGCKGYSMPVKVKELRFLCRKCLEK